MSDQNPHEPGTRILGDRYEVGDKIGAGRMTEVFRATDTVLGKTVAVKVLTDDFAEDTAFADRFVQDAQNLVTEDATAGNMTHPNLVTILDAGSETGTYWVAMELVQGSTLADTLRSKGKLPQDRAIAIVEDVCKALAFAHGHGIIHRDVTTQNILIGDDDSVKLMDVGIARPTSATTASQTAAMLGAATYISPEIARGGEPFARSDIYSLGVVLYELLTGAPPFVGESPVAVAMQHVRETPKKPSDVDPALGTELDGIVMKALAKNPAERYASADDLRKDLERFRGAETQVVGDPNSQVIKSGAAAETMMFTAPTVAKERRFPTKWALIGVAALAVIGVVIWLLFGQAQLVEVPNLIGQTEQAATNALTSASLEVIVLERDEPTQTPGMVIEQAPPPGAELSEGSTVTLTVAIAATDAVVPDVVNETQDSATGLIEQAGLSLGTVTDQASATVPGGTVISQDPPAGTGVEPGSTVNLVVSLGNEQVTLPDLACVPVDLAARQLGEIGLTMTVAGTEANALCPASPNRIARQEPLPGSSTNSGSVVSVWTTLPLESPLPSPGASLSPGASPVFPTSPPPLAAPAPEVSYGPRQEARANG